MLETLLDRLRKGELNVRSEMVDAFLRAGDVIKDQLAGHRGDGAADPVVVKSVYDQLQKFSEESSHAAVADDHDASSPQMICVPGEEQIDRVEAPKLSAAEHSASDTADSSPTTESAAHTVYQIEFSTIGLND